MFQFILRARPAKAVAAAMFAAVGSFGFAVAGANAQDYEHKPRFVTFSGADWAKDSNSYYTGGIVSLSGNLNEDGFVARFLGIYGDYDYDTTSVPGGSVDGDVLGGDIMIGYQFTRRSITTTIYVGVDYLDYDLSPDDVTNEIRGDEVGFKVAMDFETSWELPFIVSGSGSYSTAFDTYYALLRIGYNTRRFAIGPEGMVAGDESDDIQRLGGFATFRFDLSPSNSGQVTINAGHQFADDGGTFNSSGGEGAYGGISFSLSY